MSQPFDQTIPVLTEVVNEAASERAAEALAASAPGLPPAAEELINDEPAPDAAALGAQLEALATDSWTEPEWTLLEQRVGARILRQLDARVDETLDRQLRDSLADVLQQALEGLTEQLRAGLRQAIEQTVTQAVAHEIAQLQAGATRR